MFGREEREGTAEVLVVPRASIARAHQQGDRANRAPPARGALVVVRRRAIRRGRAGTWLLRAPVARQGRFLARLDGTVVDFRDTMKPEPPHGGTAVLAPPAPARLGPGP